MRTNFGNQVFAIVRQHAGASNAVSAPQICRELGWDAARERTVRRLIADEAAHWDSVVCSIPGRGFFVAQSYEEMAAYHNWLSDLVASSRNKLEAFERVCRTRGVALPSPEELAAIGAEAREGAR